MKKIIMTALCLLMIAALSLFVMATGSVTASVNAEKTTISRGESIVVTVAVSEYEACKGGSIEVSFDSSVFERSANEWLLTGTSMAVADGKAVFAYGSDSAKTISGDIYRFTLTAKSDAAFGASDVSIELKLNSTDGSSATAAQTLSVTVACSHSYENDCDTTCNICGETRTGTHSWDSGKVTTEPSCTTEGVKTYTCSVCSETKTESVAKKDHDYGSGTVTKEPTCTAEGEKTFTCSSCDSSYTESVAKLGHDYENDCDPDCGTCGAEREVSHSYRTSWSSNADGHWHACSSCGDRKDEAAHTPGEAATEWKAQTCTACGYEIQKALGHTHKLADSYSTDSEGHWHACSGCQEKTDYKAHGYDNDCDTTCDTCGHTRETEHTYGNRLSFSEEGHWYECTSCADVLEMYPHNPGPEATEESDQICLDCGYVLQPAGNHVHTPVGDWLSDTKNHWHQCGCGELMDTAEHAWDEGTTDTEANVTIYRCTVCGYPKMTAIPEQPGPVDPPEETQPSQPPQPQGGQNNQTQQPEEGSPWLIVIVVVCVLLIGGAVFVVIGILVSRKQVGKYSG